MNYLNFLFSKKEGFNSIFRGFNKVIKIVLSHYGSKRFIFEHKIVLKLSNSNCFITVLCPGFLREMLANKKFRFKDNKDKEFFDNSKIKSKKLIRKLGLKLNFVDTFECNSGLGFDSDDRNFDNFFVNYFKIKRSQTSFKFNTIFKLSVGLYYRNKKKLRKKMKKQFFMLRRLSFLFSFFLNYYVKRFKSIFNFLPNFSLIIRNLYRSWRVRFFIKRLFYYARKYKRKFFGVLKYLGFLRRNYLRHLKSRFYFLKNKRNHWVFIKRNHFLKKVRRFKISQTGFNILRTNRVGDFRKRFGVIKKRIRLKFRMYTNRFFSLFRLHQLFYILRFHKYNQIYKRKLLFYFKLFKNKRSFFKTFRFYFRLFILNFRVIFSLYTNRLIKKKYRFI